MLKTKPGGKIGESSENSLLAKIFFFFFRDKKKIFFRDKFFFDKNINTNNNKFFFTLLFLLQDMRNSLCNEFLLHSENSSLFTAFCFSDLHPCFKIFTQTVKINTRKIAEK